jgi:hypothetical protein
MTPMFFLNCLTALLGFVHVMYVLSHLKRLSWRVWMRMPWRRLAWELMFRLGYAVLGAGCAAILLGPLYGYIHPPDWEVVVNVGWVLACTARELLLDTTGTRKYEIETD